MCGTLREPSQTLLVQLSERLTTLEKYFSATNVYKVRGCFDALSEQLHMEGVLTKATRAALAAESESIYGEPEANSHEALDASWPEGQDSVESDGA